jgi:type II secretory pathway pseudopilin PulG
MFTARKGITLIELVVVIAVTTLLLAVLTPGLNKSRQLAVRLLCETNLRSIGAAIAAFAGDNDGEFPRAGGPDATWSSLGRLSAAWKKPGATADKVFGTNPPKATITSCLWLLVKNEYAMPKQFVCKGDRDVIVFGLSKMVKMGRPPSILVCWDFGGDKGLYPGDCCSYSYNMPFAINEFRPGLDSNNIINFAIDQLSSEASPVCADRNPYLDLNVNIDPRTKGDNCAAHWWEGQNVLYKDGEHQQGIKDAFLVSELQSP